MKLISQHIVALLSLVGSTAFVPSAIPTKQALEQTKLFVQNEDQVERRSFLSNSAAIASVITLAGLQGIPAPSYAADADYKAVAADIASLVKEDPNKGPTFVRLAWHSSGTYDKMTKTGGSGLGTIRFKEELAHGGNAGLGETAVKWMEPIKEKYGDDLSYADLYTLGGGK